MAILTPMAHGFSGGVHPAEMKFTEDHAIEVVPFPKRVYIPFSQHIGKPAKPIVEVGNEVKIGTMIGEADGFISAPVHASISGKVVKIDTFPHPIHGLSVGCLIESTNGEEWEQGVKEKCDYDKLSNKELVDLIREAGIVGLGGATFPTHVKLSPPDEKSIDTLIINGCECEPMLTADHRLILEYPIGIIEGARLFQKLVQAKTLVFAVEDNKKDAADVLRKEGVSVKVLKTKYPQGAEKQLIKTIVNRIVPCGGLPMDVGCLVHNVGTCYAAFQAVQFRKPLIDRIVTVAGDGVKESKNLLVKIGTPAIDIINYCGGFSSAPDAIIFGGPMMGIAQCTENAPIIKGTSGVIVRKQVRSEKEGPCVRCAACVDACPMGLMPTEIYKYVSSKKFEAAKTYGVLDCIECGCCAYVCPAKIPLVHYMKYGKNELWRRS